ncbi:MAG TPA: adenosylcobalamin-dependent ribonucleoside-diphosphate reductase [Bryobacteraceae bacterium]|nr:adenosylcobalamin-dependent ribonucleoside-diphosphate reductase [Bryobacteraceae bacterium]
MEISEDGLRVLRARYLRRNDRGETMETPDELFERVARAVSEAELLYGTAADARQWEERFGRMMAALDFLPNSPALMNAGTPLGQLSACFVLPIEDTMESIFGTLRNAALIQRTGGGTGFSFSRLRPEGDLVQTTGGVSSGPVSFMKIYDSATENIRLGGRRRGANMGVLRVDHPDIRGFVRAKRDGVSLRNFNISVAVTSEFMEAVSSGGEFALKHPAEGRAVHTVRARELFEEICEAAWATGDPGMIFIDAIAQSNPLPLSGAIEATNPCGEVPLPAYESCNLGSINLTHFVRQMDGLTAIDWDRLKQQIGFAVRFLDDSISVNRFPLKEVSQATLASRRIGLGVMGFAELCILLGISYGSGKAVLLAEELMDFIACEAGLASMRLAEHRGVFPNWKFSIYAKSALHLRNATRTSIAPTGTLSIIAGTSSGIEPLFALAYRRRLLGRLPPVEWNPLLLRNLDRLGKNPKDVLEEIAVSGNLERSDPERVFITALEIAPVHHVRIQAAFQRKVDNAVSKTVNLRPEATVGDVADVFRTAYQLRCKGVTVYRYASKVDPVFELAAGESPHEREYFARCDPGACRL